MTIYIFRRIIIILLVKMNTANSTGTSRNIPLRIPQGRLSKPLARVLPLRHTEHPRIPAGDALKPRPPPRERPECDTACDATGKHHTTDRTRTPKKRPNKHPETSMQSANPRLKSLTASTAQGSKSFQINDQ